MTNLYYRLKLYVVRDWFLQIWYCHHNARVLADMEYRFGCVLSRTTGVMSKAYYTVPAMYAEIDRRAMEECDAAVEDYKKDHDCHCDEAE